MISANDKNSWNREIARHPSFLQSWQWGELQKKIGRRVFRINASGLLASAIEQKLPLGKTYLYAPHGPVICGASASSWTDLIKEAKSMGGGNCVFFRVEPLAREFLGEPVEKILKEAGFRETKAVQPKTTLVISLGKDEKTMLEEMEHDTRYSIRAAEKRGVEIEFYEGKERDKSFGIFWEIFSETNRRHGLKAYPKPYYEEVARIEGECYSKIAVAKADGKAVSAAMFAYFGGRAFYLFAGSLAGYGKFNAPTYLLWQAIRDAKKSGFEYFDFWGISHENENWAKITAFKKSFGGTEITSPGTWDYVFNKPFYFAYNLSKRFI